MRAKRITLNTNQITAMPNDELSFSLTCHEEEIVDNRKYFEVKRSFHFDFEVSTVKGITLLEFLGFDSPVMQHSIAPKNIIFQLGVPPKELTKVTIHESFFKRQICTFSHHLFLS